VCRQRSLLFDFAAIFSRDRASTGWVRVQGEAMVGQDELGVAYGRPQ
jgi:hypothetical protein